MDIDPSLIRRLEQLERRVENLERKLRERNTELISERQRIRELLVSS